MYKCKKGMLTVTHPQNQHSNFIIIVIRVRWNSLSFLKMMKNCNHHHQVGMKGNCLHENFRFPQSLHFSKYSFFMNSTLVDTLDKSSDNFLSNSFINFKMKSTLYNITTKVQHFSRNHVRCERIVTILCWCCKSYFAKKISKITALKVFTASKAGS